MFGRGWAAVNQVGAVQACVSLPVDEPLWEDL
jgi:hypothetical protein